MREPNQCKCDDFIDDVLFPRDYVTRSDVFREMTDGASRMFLATTDTQRASVRGAAYHFCENQSTPPGVRMQARKVCPHVYEITRHERFMPTTASDAAWQRINSAG